jgi:hypothetical protein
MYDVAGMHFTQAELISSLLLLGGGLIIFYALKQKRALKLA